MALRSTKTLAYADAQTTVPFGAAPTGAAVGDIGTAWFFLNTETTAVSGVPSGWAVAIVALSLGGAKSGALHIYWKRLTADDIGATPTIAWTWTLGSSTGRQGWASCHSGRITTGNPFDFALGSVNPSTAGITRPVSITGTSVAVGCDLIYALEHWDGSTTITTTDTPVWTKAFGNANGNNFWSKDNQAAGEPGATQADTSTSSSWWATLLAIKPASSGQVLALPTASETATGQPLGASKTAALPVSSETATGQALGGAKTAALPVSSETATAQPLGATKAATLPVGSEQGEAQPLGGTKAAPLPVAVQTDEAIIFLAAGSLPLPTAVENAIAQALGAGKVATLAVAGTWETAIDLGSLKRGGLPVAAETSTAVEFTGGGPTLPATPVTFTVTDASETPLKGRKATARIVTAGTPAAAVLEGNLWIVEGDEDLSDVNGVITLNLVPTALITHPTPPVGGHLYEIRVGQYAVRVMVPDTPAGVTLQSLLTP